MESLFMPPFLLVAGLGALAVWVWRQWGRSWCAWFATALFVFGYLCSAPVVVNAAVAVLERRETNQCDAPPGSLFVLLTGGALGAPRSDTEFWRLREASYRRLLLATEIASRVPDSRLLVSGGAERGDLVPEARLVGNLAVQLGWPKDRIEEETVSTDTARSGVEVARLLRSREQPPAIVLVTSALHMPRAAAAYRSTGLAIRTCPVASVYFPPDLPGGLVPQITALEKMSAVWHEIAGLLLQAVRPGRAKS